MKDGCVAVALVAWVAGQGMTPLCADADAAAQVEFGAGGRARFEKRKRMRHFRALRPPVC